MPLIIELFLDGCQSCLGRVESAISGSVCLLDSMAVKCCVPLQELELRLNTLGTPAA